MKSLIVTSIIGTLLASAGLTQPNNTWREEWFKAKFGRNAPAEEARRKAADQANSAFRVEAAPRTTTPIQITGGNEWFNEWREQWYKMKFGRNTPMDEARRKAEQSNSAFRVELAPKSSPRTETIPIHIQQDERFKMKFGRYPEPSPSRY